MCVFLIVECVDRIESITHIKIAAYTVDLLDKDALGKVFSQVITNSSF